MRYVQCVHCYKLNDPNFDKCCNCGQHVRKQIERSPAIHVFPTGYWEHIGPDPIKIKNRQQLKDVCQEHGVRANILD